MTDSSEQLTPELQAQLAVAESLIASGEFDAGVELFQKLARSSENPQLMDRLIALRVDGLRRQVKAVDLHPMFEANDLLQDAQSLRARMAADGYLFFRDIIPVDRIATLKDDITRILAAQGWIEGGENRLEALATGRPRREGQPRFFQAHDKIIKLESFHSLAHESHLLNVMHRVLGDSAFPHPLSIVRLIFPDSPELATPPHQDYPNNQGTADLTAAWIPLSDCSVKQGSLAILEGSNQFGVLPLRFHLGAGNRRAVLNQRLSALRWVAADFRAGDVLLFPSVTVHKALENHSHSNMRLSVDFRYQREGEALTQGCLKPHFQRLDWEEIYQDWRSNEFQYYWQSKKFVEVPWNPALHELPPDHVDEAYEQELAFNLVLSERESERGPS